MNPLWRDRIIAGIAAVMSLWLGWKLAEGEYIVAMVALAIGLAAIAARLSRVSIATLAVGGLLFGYIVGNRGFAQLMPLPGLPLLPAEIVLMIAGAWVALQCAFGNRMPYRKDALNAAILVWLVLGTARVVFDVRTFGLIALRDFAMIYYALFFLLAQEIGRDENARRFLLGTLVVACVAQPIAALLTETFPDFFYGTLTIRGAPLIYFKGDLALTFMAVSALVIAMSAKGVHRYWAWPVATAELLFVFGSANRASMLGAIVALAWLAMSRARRFVGVQGAALAAAMLGVTGLAVLTENAWAQRKFNGVTERVLSIGDFVGRGDYVSEESFNKGDNNRFRTVWWRTVTEETLHRNPVFGLGFGYDLSQAFLREYSPEAEEFTARSPHSIVVSAFGRLGFAGLGVFLILSAVLAIRTWRAIRNPLTAPVTLACWAGAWIILVSACFGVVLEGPMGAVVFWILLGIANVAGPPARESKEAESVAETEARLPDPVSMGELASRP